MMRPAQPRAGSPKSLKGYLFLGLAVVTCPCHLPILLAVVAGTGLAGVLTQYFGLVVVALTVIFGASLFLGLRAMKGEGSGRPP